VNGVEGEEAKRVDFASWGARLRRVKGVLVRSSVDWVLALGYWSLGRKSESKC